MPLPVPERNPVVLTLGRRVSGLVAENRALLERAIAVQNCAGVSWHWGEGADNLLTPLPKSSTGQSFWLL